MLVALSETSMRSPANFKQSRREEPEGKPSEAWPFTIPLPRDLVVPHRCIACVL